MLGVAESGQDLMPKDKDSGSKPCADKDSTEAAIEKDQNASQAGLGNAARFLAGPVAFSSSYGKSLFASVLDLNISYSINPSPVHTPAHSPFPTSPIIESTPLIVEPIDDSIPIPPAVPSKETLLDFTLKREKGFGLPDPLPEDRQAHFHQYFPDVPSDETLLQVFHGASREYVVVQGKVYVSLNYICFRSTVLQYEPLVIRFQDIIDIQEKTHLMVKNSVSIETEKAYYFFTHLVNRAEFWKLIKKIHALHIDNSSKFLKSNRCLKHRNEFDTDFCSACITGIEGIRPFVVGRAPAIETLRKSDPNFRKSFYSSASKDELLSPKSPSADLRSMSMAVLAKPSEDITADPNTKFGTFPRRNHTIQVLNSPPVTRIAGCSCESTRAPPKSFVILRHVLPFSLENLWEKLYTVDKEGLFWEFSVKNRELTDLSASPWAGSDGQPQMIQLTSENHYDQRLEMTFQEVKVGYERVLKYIIPINSSFVKQTRAIETCRVVCKTTSSICLEASGTSPDVPYGDSFSTKTFIHLESKPNGTELLVRFWVDWTKPSWIMKGQIEAQSMRSLQKMYQDLVSFLETKVAHDYKEANSDFEEELPVESSEENASDADAERLPLIGKSAQAQSKSILNPDLSKNSFTVQNVLIIFLSVLITGNMWALYCVHVAINRLEGTIARTQ